MRTRTLIVGDERGPDQEITLQRHGNVVAIAVYDFAYKDGSDNPPVAITQFTIPAADAKAFAELLHEAALDG
jgi:hypothetical protein